MVETERRADGEYPFADLEVVIDAETYRGEIFRVDFQQRDIAALVGADDLSHELPPVAQTNDDLVGVPDDMVVGNDVSV